MKIAIVVHGRFHAFDLARALIDRGHDVTVFTNYPAWAVERFGFPKERVRSFWPHGVLSRANQWLHDKARFPYFEAALHRMFGRWAAGELGRERWDVIHHWSGVAEEALCADKRASALHLLMRGSSHIRTQRRLLDEEEQRVGVPQDKPSPWMIAREEREYTLADRIVVLSTFAYESFVAQGVPREKLRLLPLGANLEQFRPPPAVVEQRCRRIEAGEPLRVLYVGALSFRKGFWDLGAMVRRLDGQAFRFRFVGPRSREAEGVLRELSRNVELLAKRPQRRLPEVYAGGDVFVFPTIEDGYAQVLAQAAASALPILTTANCSGPDLVREGENGWVLPIRSPKAFIERLRWCDAHRKELAAMVRRIYTEFQPRTWEEVAADFEAIATECIKIKS
jgi:glycosyltransferase involved in cell wall biosynthesis